MTDSSSVAYAVGRRQKRARYWESWLQGAGLSGSVEEAFRDLIAKYRLLVAKLANAKSDEDRSTAENGLQTLDREMNVIFENRRLMTSEIGIPSVGEK